MADDTIPEMVARVARAICPLGKERRGGCGYRCMYIVPQKSGKCPYRGAAQAAIAAMREPTLDMIAAGMIAAKKVGGPWLTLMEGTERCPETWRAMIDKALEE